MEDSEFVFEELGDTAEIMERGGLLPDGPNEEMELRDTLFQDGTCPKLRGFDIRVQEGLETAAEGIRHNVIVHSEELSDLCPEDKIRKEEEFETPPRGGDPRRWTGFQTDGPRDRMIDMGPVPDYVAAQRMVPTDRNRPSNALSPVETLEGTVLEMRRDMENLQTENRFLRTRRIPGPVPLVRQAALTTTKVPGFNGSTSWEQYQQVFDAIALSNGWGDATAALQLLSHLQGDALSVALLLPMPRRSSRKELTHALSSHYGSPGRLASYRRQFDKTERIPGEDPANFGITLETLAVKAFGDIGQTARLRLIRDRFIAGHGSCDLRRHLDCLPPDTPLRDIVDRCRVWESHAELAERNVNQPKLTYPAYAVKPMEEEPDVVRAVSVDKSASPVEDNSEIIKKIVDMLAPGSNLTRKATEPSAFDKLVHMLREHVVERKPAVPETTAPTELETKFKTFLDSGRRAYQGLGTRLIQRDWSAVKCFSCGNSGHSAARCPKLDITFPFMLPGWRAEKTSIGYMMISPRRAMDRNRSENAN